MNINLNRLPRLFSSYTRYGVAVFSVLLSLLLLPLWGTRSPFLLFIPAVMVSSHYGGLGPGLLATILSGLLGFGFLPQWSYESVLNPHLGDLLRLGVFFAIGAFVSLLNRRLLSEKQRAEASSRSYQESEERYRLLVDQVKDYAFYTIDPDGIVNTWNTGAERLKGYRPADIMGRSFALCFPPEEIERGKPESILQEAIAHGQWVDEGWHVRKDGSLFWAEAVTTALRDERGRLRGFSQVVHDISDRKQAEEALRETNHTLQTIIQASPLAIMTFDRQGKIGLWSPAAERIFGWSEQEVMGHPAPMSQGSYQEEFQRNLKQAFQGASLDGIEAQRPRKDGQTITVNGWSAPLQDTDGVVRSIVAIMADVTERKRAEQALIEAYQQNTEILESISDAFYAVDHDWKFTYINRKAEQLWRKRREDLIGKRIWAEFPQAVGTESYEAHMQAVREQKTVSYETYSPVINIWLRVNIYPSANGLSIYFADISDRKRAEQSLKRYAERLETLHAIDNVILLARSLEDPVRLALTRICSLIPCQQAFILLFELESNQARMLTGVESGEPLPLEGTTVPIDDFVPVETIKQEPYRYIEDIEAHHHCSPGLQQLLGQEMRSCLTVPLLAEENLVGVLNLGTHQRSAFNDEHLQIAQEVANQLAIAIQQSQLRDQLEHYTLELETLVEERTSELQDANSELEAFAYSVSHDLRTPLQAMQGFAQALVEDYTDQLDVVGKDYAQRISNAAMRMDALIENLLQYSRLSRASIQLQPISLKLVIEEAMQLLETRIEETHAEITVREPLLSAIGHRSTLIQVVMNLINNAMKFVAPAMHPRIEIWTEDVEDWTRLWIQDNGIGIAVEQQERIFNIFERLHGLDAYPGTGIGLAIVRKGVERMGGRVGVESQVGQGSRFWIELPSPNNHL
ncbi:PAS domain S-box protein [Oscillatoria sp. FACHB-1407]|uniref:PAS domain S-box protein n=1 Tax=Oscillatoria sp. FACHB-1407 TaxID=2692847 RepID=UPI00168403B9|nr:PAS domain S-box protein [Oscillatoria sp. FACHB-1407]MBD2465906.1 PAS domain S-box protein [Oscillatoria sp. FACHB-1407]